VRRKDHLHSIASGFFPQGSEWVQAEKFKFFFSHPGDFQI
jgi:hypothetical protein